MFSYFHNVFSFPADSKARSGLAHSKAAVYGERIYLRGQVTPYAKHHERGL